MDQDYMGMKNAEICEDAQLMDISYDLGVTSSKTVARAAQSSSPITPEKASL